MKKGILDMFNSIGHANQFSKVNQNLWTSRQTSPNITNKVTVTAMRSFVPSGYANWKIGETKLMYVSLTQDFKEISTGRSNLIYIRLFEDKPPIELINELEMGPVI